MALLMDFLLTSVFPADPTQEKQKERCGRLGGPVWGTHQLYARTLWGPETPNPTYSVGHNGFEGLWGLNGFEGLWG